MAGETLAVKLNDSSWQDLYQASWDLKQETDKLPTVSVHCEISPHWTTPRHLVCSRAWLASLWRLEKMMTCLIGLWSWVSWEVVTLTLRITLSLSLMTTLLTWATFLSVSLAFRSKNRWTILHIYHCKVSSFIVLQVMHDLHQTSGPFLFPCTIEFSLICAAILFIMWKHVGTEHEYSKLARLQKLHDNK